MDTKVTLKCLLLLCIFKSALSKIDVTELRCLVCRTIMEEIDIEVSSQDPNKRVNVGSYRLDSTGNSHTKSVVYAKSEMYLSELMESVCDKMDDYVRATWKRNGQLTLLRIITQDGKMNSEMSNVDIITDNDLNKSLKFYCQGILEEYEEDIVRLYAENHSNVDVEVCSNISHLCKDTVDQEYDFSDKEEL